MTGMHSIIAGLVGPWILAAGLVTAEPAAAPAGAAAQPEYAPVVGVSREDVILDAKTLETKLDLVQRWDADTEPGPRLNANLDGRKVSLGGACRLERTL